MTMTEYRAYLVRKQSQIRFQSDDDEGAAMYYGDLALIIETIDAGADVEQAANWVGVEYLVSK